MIAQTDKHAADNWKRLNQAFINYQRYLDSKVHRFNLSIVDLLYISNFKGGDASITEDSYVITEKLERYSDYLQRIDFGFGKRFLSDIQECDDLDMLVLLAIEFMKLTDEPKAKISGFRSSYASAMLCAYFPEILPILDHRAINGAQIPANWKKNGSRWEIKDIDENYQEYYELLFYRVHAIAKKNPGLSLREIDFNLFIKEMNPNAMDAIDLVKGHL